MEAIEAALYAYADFLASQFSIRISHVVKANQGVDNTLLDFALKLLRRAPVLETKVHVRVLVWDFLQFLETKRIIEALISRLVDARGFWDFRERLSGETSEKNRNRIEGNQQD